MRILYFDCFNGASGDMVLGALLDAGLPLSALREALGSLAIEDVEEGGVTAWPSMRSGVPSGSVNVRPPPATAVIAVKVWFCSLQSAKFSGATRLCA